jgi:hypothetical protein
MDFKLRPHFHISHEAELQIVPRRNPRNSDENEQNQCESLMYKCDIIWRRTEVMCSGYGSTKRQAERNASVQGIRYLNAHPEHRIKD